MRFNDVVVLEIVENSLFIAAITPILSGAISTIDKLLFGEAHKLFIARFNVVTRL